jgi:hypothetical protein
MEATSIGNAISVGGAAKKLGINPHRCKGLIEGLGIHPRKIGRMYVIDGRDFARLRRRVDAVRDVGPVLAR